MTEQKETLQDKTVTEAPKAEGTQEAPKKKREVLPGVKMLQDIVTDVYQAAWDAKKRAVR